MRALVTGAAGFAGSHLVERVLAESHEVVAADLEAPRGLPAGAVPVALDVCDEQACWSVLAEARPDVVFHLAGFAHVGKAESEPARCLAVNFGGTRNLLESCLAGFARTRFVLASSAEVYGAVPPERLPVTEDQPLRPATIYAVSKACAEMALQHAVARGLHAVVARPFNHIGPRQSQEFAASAFALQVARAEVGLAEPVLRVGNLEAVRDFSDVREIAAGYLALAEHARPGEAFNLTSECALPVRRLVEVLVELARVPLRVEVEADRLRALDVKVFHGSGRRLAERCGFAPRLDLARTLGDVLDYWRATVAAAPVR